MMNYDSILSDRAKALKPSGIRKFFDILETIDTEGRRTSALSEEIRQTMHEHLNTYKRGSK